MLERERARQLIELEAFCASSAGATLQYPASMKKTKTKAQMEKRKVESKKAGGRADGKGRAYRSLIVGGFEVLIGKGDADNDNLTFKVADSLDFWLHVANIPGSHVVIRNPDRVSEPPRDVLERAAGLAAFYSKARDGSKVEVHWCRVADVNKPRGFMPGKVILKSYKSLKVYPKE
jgi:predicted ribosome quality control (RQC) complex YloA/Tae2 family protein